MDSGVSILNLSTSRKVLSLLLLASTFGEAWGLETGDCKTREILHFPPFLLCSLTEETSRLGCPGIPGVSPLPGQQYCLCVL